jgi:hypothetical protein
MWATLVGVWARTVGRLARRARATVAASADLLRKIAS